MPGSGAPAADVVDEAEAPGAREGSRRPGTPVSLRGAPPYQAALRFASTDCAPARRSGGGGGALRRALRATEDPLAVNTPPEDAFRAANIPESKSIPQSEPNFESRVAEIAGSKERPVVISCASAECDASPKAAKTLEQAGFERVYNFEGGLNAWKEAGSEMESGDCRRRRGSMHAAPERRRGDA